VFDLRDAVNPPLEARLPHPCGRRPRIVHAGALFGGGWFVKSTLLGAKPGGIVLKIAERDAGKEWSGRV